MTTRSSSYLFWTLVRLRYQLIWAQARTSPGRVAVLLLVSLFFLSIGALIGVVGLGTAVAGTHFGRAEFVTRGVLSGFHASAVMTTLFFGLGPRRAFSEHALRRFPLTSKARVLIRHLIGLIDPIWFLLATSAFGIAIGLTITGAGSLLVGLLAAALYVMAAYLTAVFVLALVERLMQSATGAAVMGILGLAALSFSGLGVAWFVNPDHPERLAVIDRALHFAPSGVAASLMVAGAPFMTGLVRLVMLVLWCGLLLGLVGWLEQHRGVRPSSVTALSAGHDFESPYDRFAGLFGALSAPLAAKAMRYYLRSNRVRLGLASAPIFAFIGRLMSSNSGALGGVEFYFTLAFFSFLGFSGPSSIALNQFGSDGDGVRRYAMLPVRFAAPIRAGSLVAVLLGLLVTVPTIALWAIVTTMDANWRVIAMLLGSSLGGLFLFNGLAMWTTIFSPKGVDFSSMLNNRLPLGGNVVVGGGLILVLALHFVLMQFQLETVLRFWWAPLAFGGAGLVFYVVCWWGIGGVADARRNRVIDVIAS